MQIFITIILIVAIVLAYILSKAPYFAAMIIRAAFEKSEHKPPSNYDQTNDSITVYNDAEYPSKYGTNVLDIYLPRSINHPTATIIWMHGGGYVGGDKREARYFASSLAANGFAVVSFNYELAPEANYPTPLIQLGEVCEFIKSDKQFNFDTSQLVFAGSSAGAHCVAQFITIQSSLNYADLIGIKQTVPLEDIKAVLLYCGFYDLEKLGTQSSSIINFMIRRAMWAYFGTRDWGETYGQLATIKYNITLDFPPTFITDGNRGSFESDGKELEQTMRNLGASVESHFIDINDEKVGHEYQYNLEEPASKIVFQRTIDFLNKYMIDKPSPIDAQ